MKRATVYLYDWQYARLQKLMHEYGMPSVSDTIRTLLTYSAKDFEAFLKEEKEEENAEEEEDPDIKGIRLLMRILDATRRLEDAQALQNISFPGFWWDFEPTLNRLGEARGDREPFERGAAKIIFQRDPIWDLITTGRRA